jgi:hypothetical protein
MAGFTSGDRAVAARGACGRSYAVSSSRRRKARTGSVMHDPLVDKRRYVGSRFGQFCEKPNRSRRWARLRLAACSSTARTSLRVRSGLSFHCSSESASSVSASRTQEYASSLIAASSPLALAASSTVATRAPRSDQLAAVSSQG